MTQIFLLAPANPGSFPDPGNWNPLANIVECVGAGGQGSTAYTAPGRADDGPVTFTGTSTGRAGGGGAYAYGKNLTPVFPINIFISPTGGTLAGFSLTSFGGLNGSDQTNSLVSADSGVAGLGMNSGGQGGAFVKPNGYGGGSGGGGPGATGNGGGGGGAAGPYGNGANGAVGGASIGAGGAADGGTIAGGTAAAPAGLTAPRWDLSHGVGSGGAGASTAGSVAGGAGGMYGGGGGAAATGSTGGGPGAGTPGLIIITYLPLKTKQIFLLNNLNGSFPDPGDWNQVNMVECVGAGGFGGTFSQIESNGGGGGGGGAYAYGSNRNFPFPVTYSVLPPSNAGGGSFTVWGAGGTSPGGGNQVSAACGYTGARGGVGGGGGQLVYPNGYQGGSGAMWSSTAPLNGGGGGGAAGPHGAGVSASASVSTVGNLGAAGDAGVTPGPIAGAASGLSGTQFNPWAVTPNGIGSGGSGGISTSLNGGAGGNYGGGGGGAYQATGATPGAGSGGLIVLTYIPNVPPQGQAQIMA